MGGSRGARINGIGLLMAVFVFGDSITEHVGTFGGEQERRPPRCASISVAEVAGLMLLGRDSYICSCSPDKASMIPFIGCSTYVLGRTVLNFGPRATPGCTPPQHHLHDAHLTGTIFPPIHSSTHPNDEDFLTAAAYHSETDLG